MSAGQAPTADDPHTLHFGGLHLSSGPGVIVPRPWTILQSEWAAELSPSLPDGPLLELCAGCGVIGLEAARLTGRAAVLVDASDEAVRWARHNAEENDLAAQVEIRCTDLAHGARAGERFPLILADPPYLPSDEVDDHPDDPEHAIDGGPDGLDVLRRIVDLLPDHLADGGAVLVQVKGADQADELEQWMVAQGSALHVDEVRSHDDHRAIMRLIHR